MPNQERITAMMPEVLTMCAVLYAEPNGGRGIPELAHGPYPCKVAEKIVSDYVGPYQAHAERVTPQWTPDMFRRAMKDLLEG
jgi:hypothetical protein